jgi:dolichol-phosphate mannosyltransferase
MKTTSITIDLVVPVYNEQQCIRPLYEKVKTTLSGIFAQTTIIFIDDGSLDQTENEIEKIIPHDGIKICYIKLARNFGKEIAVKSGIDNSKSDLCAIIDGDLQHPPEKIIDAFEKLKEGYNIVHISRNANSGPIYRGLGSRIFDKIINFFAPTRIHFTDFKLLDRKAIEVIQKFNEADYYNRGIIDLIGLNTAEIYYKPEIRLYGKSKFSLKKLVNLAIDGLISVSIRPLRISIYFGLIISVLSFFWGIFILIEKLLLGQPIPGFTTLAVALFFLGGIQLLFLGIIGEYVGKTFIESKKRPQYIINYIKEK